MKCRHAVNKRYRCKHPPEVVMVLIPDRVYKCLSCGAVLEDSDLDKNGGDIDG